MVSIAKLFAGIVALALIAAASTAQAATYVYVSNAEDGTIGTYVMATDGTLTPGARVEAQKLVMPMAVSPDKRFLFAAARAKPVSLFTFAIKSQPTPSSCSVRYPQLSSITSPPQTVWRGLRRQSDRRQRHRQRRQKFRPAADDSHGR